MNASSLFPPNGFHTVVEILENEGEWFVRVAQVGRETITNYQIMSRALAYAERQRLRLNLAKFDIL
jgi:hypothetical protein